GGKTTSGRGSVLGGTQADAPITAPANICGNSVALLGDAFSGCAGGAKATRDSGPRKSRSLHRGSTGHDTDGRFGAGSGNQVVAPIVAPVNLCGNAVGNATAGCKGGSSAHTKGGSDAGGNRTSGRSSVAGGNQVLAPITAPVNVCGNTIGAAGRAFAGCAGGLSVKNRGQAPGGNRTSGHSGVGGGNQVFAPITAPVNACGNAAAALGDAAGGCLGGAHLGRPGPKKGYGHAHQSRKAHASGSSTIPPRPRHSDAHQMSGGLPIVGDVAGQLGLAQVPGLPGLPATAAKPAKPSKPAQPAKSSKAKPAKPAKKPTAAAANPAADLVATTPLGGAVKSATSSLPIGLMSAAQPAGVTGMSNASLLALVLGGLFAVTASVFSVTRRFRPSGK